LKVVQERARHTLELIDMGNYFLNRTQIAQQLRERIDKCDYMKVKIFSIARGLGRRGRGEKERERNDPNNVHTCE
jgi:hypothetical protein